MAIRVYKCSIGVSVIVSSIVLLTAAFARSAPITAGFTGIEARYASGQDQTRSAPDPAQRAIDGNLSTETYITKSFTSGPVFIYLDLGSPQYVQGLRIHKLNNEYGSHTLAIDYSTGAGTISTRTYNAVANLQAGFESTELPIFGIGGGIVGNSVVRENGGVSAPYIYSTTFSGISDATAIRLTLTDDASNTHLRVSEIQTIVPEPASSLLFVMLGAILLCCRKFYTSF